MTDVVMLPGWEREIADALRPSMSRFVGRVANNSRRRAPKRTGALAVSIYSRVNRDGSGEVGVSARHALWVLEGTGIYGPHHTPIIPVRSPYLIFTPYGSNYRVFARSVRGQVAQPFLTEALFDELAQGFN